MATDMLAQLLHDLGEYHLLQSWFAMCWKILNADSIPVSQLESRKKKSSLLLASVQCAPNKCPPNMGLIGMMGIIGLDPRFYVRKDFWLTCFWQNRCLEQSRLHWLHWISSSGFLDPAGVLTPGLLVGDVNIFLCVAKLFIYIADIELPAHMEADMWRSTNWWTRNKK